MADGDEDVVEVSKTPNRDVRLGAAAAGTDPERPGKFRVKGPKVHGHTIPPVLVNGHIQTPHQYIEVQPGQTFDCSGTEARMCRSDPEKFQEL